MENPSFKQKLLCLALLGLDFDGTLTDGYVYVDQEGKETVRCSRKDGPGINMLQHAGVHVCVISKETNRVVAERCRKMGIPCYQAVETGEGKREILSRIAQENGISQDEVGFMGDDVNDIPALRYAGIRFTVADAHPTVKKVADYITHAKGGEHAVREISELILAAKGKTIIF
ncbi:MAG: HAD hydrolase family protein [Parcubacteria group bacterium]|nr:HAD hydrolase family protein [Parcubacteria group bacterium]